MTIKNIHTKTPCGINIIAFTSVHLNTLTFGFAY